MRQFSPTLIFLPSIQAAGPHIRYHVHTKWVRPCLPSCCCPQPGHRLFPARLYPHPHHALKIRSTRTRATRDTKNRTNTRAGFRTTAGTSRPASNTCPSQPHALVLSRNDQSGWPISWLGSSSIGSISRVYSFFCQNWLRRLISLQ